MPCGAFVGLQCWLERSTSGVVQVVGFEFRPQGASLREKRGRLVLCRCSDQLPNGGAAFEAQAAAVR